MSLIQMTGGLDLISPVSSGNPGSLISCLNFEVAFPVGYRRIDGIQRFDGRSVPLSLQLYTLRAEYDTDENKALYVYPLHDGNAVWPPEGFAAMSAGDYIYYQRLKFGEINSSGDVDRLHWDSNVIPGRVIQVPGFVEVSGVDTTNRTGLFYLEEKPEAGNLGIRASGGTSIPSIDPDTYWREAISDKPTVQFTALYPGVGWPSIVNVPGVNFAIFNNVPEVYDFTLGTPTVPWEGYNIAYALNQATYRQTVNEFPGGVPLGHVWDKDKQYAVAETYVFAFSNADNTVRDLLENGQWCYYNPTYQLATDGNLGVTNDRSLIEADGSTIYQHAFCMRMDDEIELLIPKPEPSSSDEAQDPTGLDLYLLTEVRFSGLIRMPPDGSALTASSWGGTLRAMFMDKIGDVGFALVETTSGSLAAGDTVAWLGDTVFYVTAVSGGSSAGNPLCEVGSSARTERDAVIVKSTERRGYMPIDMGYEVRIENGVNEPLTVYEKPDATPEDKSTGALNAGVSVTKHGASGISWTAMYSSSSEAIEEYPQVIESVDGDYALSSLGGPGLITKWLLIRDFNVNMDHLASITGIEIVVNAKRGAGTGTLYLESIGYYTGEEDRVWGRRVRKQMTGSATSYAFGGQYDAFDTGMAAQPPLNPTLVNSSTFGIAVQFRTSGTGTYPVEAHVEAVSLNIYYTTGTTTVYVYDPVAMADIGEAKVVHKYVESGTWAGADVTGVLSMHGDFLDIEPGMEIRTASSGAGVLVADAASSANHSRLPGLAALDANKSKYQFISTNFFAAESLRAIYGVNGAGPAFVFSDNYFFFLRTGLDEELSKPRHVGRLIDRLVLAYGNGNMDISSTGLPSNFDAVSGDALTIGVGEKITGLLAYRGDSILVFTENQIRAYQNINNSELNANMISLSSGAIEYTVVDMGVPVFCDFRGIGTIDTSEKYGDFTRGRLSQFVKPWLTPRLQDKVDFNGNPIGIACVVVVRSKDQYRVIFRDGYVLTMTLDESGAQFTIQEYKIKRNDFFADANGSEVVLIPSEWKTDEESVDVLSASWGVMPNGLDRAFIGCRNYNYMLELDRGITFDGQPIASNITLRLGSAGELSLNKRFNLLHVYGSVFGQASLTHQVAADFDTPAGPEIDFILGSNADDYSDYPVSKATKTRVNIRGRDVVLKINHNESDEQPFTLQAYEWPDMSRRKQER